MSSPHSVQHKRKQSFSEGSPSNFREKNRNESAVISSKSNKDIALDCKHRGLEKSYPQIKNHFGAFSKNLQNNEKNEKEAAYPLCEKRSPNEYLPAKKGSDGKYLQSEDLLKLDFNANSDLGTPKHRRDKSSNRCYNSFSISKETFREDTSPPNEFPTAKMISNSKYSQNVDLLTPQRTSTMNIHEQKYKCDENESIWGTYNNFSSMSKWYTNTKSHRNSSLSDTSSYRSSMTPPTTPSITKCMYEAYKENNQQNSYFHDRLSSQNKPISIKDFFDRKYLGEKEFLEPLVSKHGSLNMSYRSVMSLPSTPSENKSFHDAQAAFFGNYGTPQELTYQNVSKIPPVEGKHLFISSWVLNNCKTMYKTNLQNVPQLLNLLELPKKRVRYSRSQRNRRSVLARQRLQRSPSSESSCCSRIEVTHPKTTEHELQDAKFQ